MTFNEFGGLGLILAAIVASLIIIYGWVMNIINLINGLYEATSTMIVGFIGIPIPLVGALTHFIAG